MKRPGGSGGQSVASRGTADARGRDRRAARAVTVLAAVAVACILIYVFAMVTGSWDFTIRLRLRQVASMVLVGSATALSAVLFQTITGNRILTPGVMGFDNVYQLLQTLVVFFVGGAAALIADARTMFAISAFAMIGFALVLFRLLFAGGSRDLYVLVLIGIVVGTMFTGISSLVGRMIDPNDYATLSDLLFASMTDVKTELLAIAAVVLVAASVAAVRMLPQLDVIALGRDQAIALGVDFRKVVTRVLILVALLMSVSTALVGPITFLGLLVANLGREIAGTFRHRWIIPSSMLVAIIALVGGQFVLARLLHFGTALIVVVNFVGGLYFIALLLRGAKL